MDDCLIEVTAWAGLTVQTIYGEPRLYGNGETDLIIKTWLRFNKVNRPSI